MIQLSTIREVVKEALRNVDAEKSEGEQLKLNLSDVLFGENGALDSLALVAFVIDVERLCNEKLSIDLALTDDKAMSRSPSPFISGEELVDYIYEITR